MTPHFIINGLFYSQKTTGVHRFAREIILELDKIIEADLCSIAIPKGVQVPNLSNIKFVEVGTHHGMLWEQWDLPRFVKKQKGTLISLCNSQPLLKPGIICIHDAAYKTHPEYFKTFHGKMSVIWHRLVYRQATKWTNYPILTVSYFSKYSLIDTYRINPSRITVVGNGWQHLKTKQSDDCVLEKNGLQKDSFYFTLGNINYNKNTRWVVEYAQKHPNETFVLSGVRVKNSSIDIDHTPNIKYLGFLSDEEIVSLYQNCKAFIFPSIHEGFGIPPMEALYFGAKIIISNTTCLPEIYQGSAHYIDAYSTDCNLNELITQYVNPPNQVLDRYGWDISAQKIKNIMLNMTNC